ncbi:MAG: hypothetical protein OHK0039_36630 [Bacteroidia bacterium]
MSDALNLAFGAVMAPQALILQAAFEAIDLLPAEQRDKAIKLMLAKAISAVELLREPPEALRQAVTTAIPGAIVDPTTLWPLMASAYIGFLKHLDTLEGDELFNKARTAVSAISKPAYFLGSIWGMLQGVGSWFKDMFELIVMLSKLSTAFVAPPLFVFMYSDEIKKAWEAAGVVATWMSDNKDAILTLLQDKEALLALKDVAKSVLYSLAEGLGAKAAQGILGKIDEGPFAMGEAGGKIVGYFLPDILLAVGTDGISELLKGVQVISRSVRAAALSVEEVALAISTIEKMIGSVKAMKIFGQGSKLGELGTKFAELLESLMKVFRGFNKSQEDLIKKILEIARKKGIQPATLEKLYNLENLEHGLLNPEFVKSPYFKECIQILLDGSHGSWQKTFQSITYAQHKGRFSQFKVIFEAYVHGKILPFPRGFQSAEQFAEFSREMRAILGKYSSDIRIQGSSTMGLEGKVKDIDIAVFANEAELIQAMKNIWAKEFAKYYKLAKVPEAAAIDTRTFLQFLEEAGRVGKGGVAPNGVAITGEMESAYLAWKNGKIFGSKFLTNAEKRVRDSWKAKLALEGVDLSLIMGGKAFDVGPMIPLIK